MPDATICKERILSEDYRDFILNGTQTTYLAEISTDNVCEQDAGFRYRCIYIPAIQAEPITLRKFPYASIPKCYAPTSLDTLNQTGILPIQNYPTLQLKGNGVLIGFLDSGIDYTNPVFRNLDGTTRILGIWDQTVHSGPPPESFVYGTEFTQEQINTALTSETPFELVPSTDTDGHGTFVASLAAGSGVPAQNFLGAAPESTIAVVKLKQAKQYLRDYYFIPQTATAYQETDLILGLKYLSDLAAEHNLPLVLCISVGTSSGGHVGTLPFSSILEILGAHANIIPVVGVGNEADKRHHFQYQLQNTSDTRTVEVRVGERVSGFTMELWTRVPNVLSISIVSPSGESRGPVSIRSAGRADFQFIFEGTPVTVDFKLLVERTNYELIFFRFQNPPPGIWRVNVIPLRITDGLFHMWLPVTEFLSGEVYFLDSNPYYTMTNPANTSLPIIVSYYNGSNNAIALSSGRGYERGEQVRPNITAPGIDISGALPGERFSIRSGSSLSTAVTAGACALLLEWILLQLGVQSIDSYQLKSLLILGATRPDNMVFPNPEWGYGQLNLYNTFEELRRY